MLTFNPDTTWLPGWCSHEHFSLFAVYDEPNPDETCPDGLLNDRYEYKM